MIDAKRYLEKKKKGLVRLAKLGDAHVATWDTFDPETGEKLKPVVEAIDLDGMKKVRKNANDLLIGIDGLIADLEALKPV